MEYSTNTMVTPYDNTNTITKMFNQIQRGVQIVDAENIPFTNVHIIDKTYILLHNTVPYSEEFKSWDFRPESVKVWLKFCIHFYQAYKYVINSQIATGQDGFNISNVVMQQETTEALNDLESAIFMVAKQLNISTQPTLASSEKSIHQKN